jgi:hypothetical protein
VRFFFGGGGIRALKQELTEFGPDFVFVCVGDINLTAASSRNAVVKDIRKLVNELVSAGVKRILSQKY